MNEPRASVQSMRWAAIWPWRGLGWALLAAVLAHMAAWKLAHTQLALSLPSSVQDASFTTRIIDPVPVALLPAELISQPSRTTEKASNAALRSTSSEAVLGNISGQASSLKQKNESNQAFARMQTTQSATEIIAPNSPTANSIAAPTATLASAEPAPASLNLSYPANTKLQFELVFMSKGSSQQGSAVLSWKMDGASYELSLEASALIIFSRLEKSEGQLSPQGLAPVRFSSQRNRRSEQATHFRAEVGKIQFSNNKPDAVLLAGAQDRLSALIQLAGIIGGAPDLYKTVQQIPMQVAGLDNAEIWEFNLQGISEVTVAGVSMPALKLSRTPRNEFDQRLEIWLAPQLGYLPIRIRHSSVTTPDQDFTDLVLRKLP